MFDALLRGPTPWIILAVVVLLFGATRLPALARSLGQSMKIFRSEFKSRDATDGEADSVEVAAPGLSTSASPTPVDDMSSK